MTKSKTSLVFFLNLPLDWERLGPLLEVAYNREDINVILVATKKIRNDRSSRYIQYGKLLNDKWFLFGLGWVFCPQAIITATESSANPHRRTHRMVKYANFLNICTITLQHGYENIGITYLDEIHGKDIQIASSYIFIWQEINQLPESFKDKIGDRCISTGYIGTRADKRDIEVLGKSLVHTGKNTTPVIGFWILVTENLHWHRYNSDYRDAFMSGLFNAAKIFPDTGFIIKPHPAGLFLSTLAEQEKIKNIFHVSELIENKDFMDMSITTWLSCVDGLISTPSTTVIDCVIKEKPVLIVRNELAGEWPYEPLFKLDNGNDWIKGIQMMRDKKDELIVLSKKFIEQNLTKSSTPDEIMETIIKTANEHKSAKLRKKYQS